MVFSVPPESLETPAAHSWCPTDLSLRSAQICWDVLAVAGEETDKFPNIPPKSFYISRNL